MSFNIYPVIKQEDFAGYKVKINGEQAELNTARVSKVPFNRRWPGHQRQKEQTELINFLSFETNEALNFEIEPPEPFDRVEIRPKSLGIEPQITAEGKIVFTLEKPAYFTVEPYGRQKALHVFGDAVYSYDIDLEDENVLYFGEGEHDAGIIELKSNQTLFIDKGAVVCACIVAKDAQNIKILGKGILDNSKNKEEILFEANEENNEEAVLNAKRRHTVQIEYCDNVVIDGITIRDSLVYNIRPIGCKNLNITNVKIIGCWRFNSDGIDMHNCENVVIEKCFIRTFDDSVCIKGFDFYSDENPEKVLHEAMYRNGKAYENFKNARVRNCVIWNDWGKALEIGAETKAKEICDIIFENCSIIHATGTSLDCFNVDFAEVHDITYRDIDIEYDEIMPEMRIQAKDEDVYEIIDKDYSPNLISVLVAYHKEYSKGGNKRGKNYDINFENINLYGRHFPKAKFSGYDEEHGTKNVLIKNLRFNGELITKFPEDTFITENFAENIRLITENN